ncbi:S1C family serine protease [bacterium]|nr:S1C family serine protease [bacterium]
MEKPVFYLRGRRERRENKNLVVFLCVLCVLCGELNAQETEILETNKITITSLLPSGAVLKTGFGFLYDENTIVCSYSDVKGASKVQVQWDGTSTYTNRLLSFNESMDIAVLAAEEEIPVITPIISSNTLAIGDKVSYWTEKNGRWELTQAAVHEILDTGKGYDLILIESSLYSSRSTPLYDSAGKIIGWVQGKRAIPMETIASFAEKRNESVTMADVNRIEPQWKFEKPASPGPARFLKLLEMKMVSGPSAFPFKLDLPKHWVSKIYERSNKFHLRSAESGIVIEIRSTSSWSDDVIEAIEKSETMIFADFLRSELIPYSVDYLTGFRAYYEDSDPLNPYAMHAFYTSSGRNFYILSVSYPKGMEEEIRPFVDQVFSSFRI